MKSVIDFINQPSEYDWEFESTYIEPFNTTYSFYSFAAEGNSERSYIVESSDKGMIKLAETNNEYSIWELSPVKIQVNNHPVLLLWLGYPETDIEWYSPAVFDGSQFIITNDRIIDLTKFQINEEASN